MPSRHSSPRRPRGARASRTVRGPVVLAATPLLALAACAPAPEAPPAPDVIVLSVDTLRRDFVGSYGHRNPRRDASTTPVFDALAAEGARFADAVSSSSWTLPAHMSLMTGLPDALHGVNDTSLSVDRKLTLMAEVFGEAGYATGGFFSGPNLHPVFGFDQGFDAYVDCTQIELPEELFGERSERPGGSLQEVHNASHEAVTSPVVHARAAAWLLGVPSDQRYFLFAHYWDPHYDLIAPPEFRERYVDPAYDGRMRGIFALESRKVDASERSAADIAHVRALYDAEIDYTDEWIGRLFDEVRARGRWDDTLVLWTSDHGEEIYERGRWGHRYSLLEEEVAIPMALRYPRAVPAGVVVQGQARLYDVLPTVVELAGLQAPPYVFGQSLMDRVADPEAPGPPAHLELRLMHKDMHWVARREGPLKAIVELSTNSVRLFDHRRRQAELQGVDPTNTRGAIGGVYERLLQDIADFGELRAALPGGGRTEAIQLNPELEGQLRAMGYLDSE
jgi:arylsulfatase A-like enzyme